jgi:hypothetical protein
MKKIFLIILIALTTSTLSVNADNNAAKKGESGYDSLIAQYNKGIQQINVNGHGIITLYGYSNCNSSSCDYRYSNASQDFKEVLKSSIKCTNGEKYIIPQYNDNPEIWYKSGNNFTGEAAWSEDFDITCTNTSTSSTVTLNNSTSQPTTQASNGSGDYGSSGGTTSIEDQSVETYYIIIGIVGINTYLLTIVVKKQNLFKKV